MLAFRGNKQEFMVRETASYREAAGKLGAWERNLKLPHERKVVISILKEMDWFLLQLQRSNPDLHRMLAPEAARISGNARKGLEARKTFFADSEKGMIARLAGEEC